MTNIKTDQGETNLFRVVDKPGGFSVESEGEVFYQFASRHLAEEACKQLNYDAPKDAYGVAPLGRFTNKKP